MDDEERGCRVPLNIDKLTKTSRAFIRDLLSRLPNLRRHCRMLKEPCGDQYHLDIELESPSTKGLVLAVFVDEDGEISVGFGPWHTHATTWEASQTIDGFQCGGLVDLIERILEDLFVVCYDVGGEHDGAWGVLDLRQPDALVEELTSKYSPGKMRLVSWNGTRDGVYDLDSLA